MTHHGAIGANSLDGDDADAMTSIPHIFFKREADKDTGCVLPELGEYAVDNIFFGKGDSAQRQAFQSVFSDIANSLGLHVLGWHRMPPMDLSWVPQHTAKNQKSTSPSSSFVYITVTAPPPSIVTSMQNYLAWARSSAGS